MENVSSVTAIINCVTEGRTTEDIGSRCCLQRHGEKSKILFFPSVPFDDFVLAVRVEMVVLQEPSTSIPKTDHLP